MTMKTKRRFRRYTNGHLLSIMRYILLVPLFYGLASLIYILLSDGYNPATYQGIGESIRILTMTTLALVAGYGLGRLEHKYDIHLPKVLLVVVLTFVAMALVVGDGFGAYGRFWWWDDALHASSGVIIAMIGFLLIYFFNAEYNMRMNPTFVALFTFSFAIMLAVLWEIFEFTLDVLFATDMQGWGFGPETIMIGNSYQGPALRDTMSDLIVACVGAAATSVLAFFSYKNERTRVLMIMQRTFPSKQRRKKAIAS